MNEREVISKYEELVRAKDKEIALLRDILESQNFLRKVMLGKIDELQRDLATVHERNHYRYSGHEMGS